MNSIYYSAMCGIGLCVFACGLFLLLAEMFGVPTYRTQKAVKAMLTPPKTKENNAFERLIDALAQPLSSVFPFSTQQVAKYGEILESANMKISPKLYLSRSIVKACLLFVVSALASIVVKPLFLVALLMPVLVYLSELQKADQLTKNYRKSIEKEMPEFVATIGTQLLASRDIIRMMQEYGKTASANFKKELQITLVDMQSGNYEDGLKRFSNRINSSAVHSAVRGLIGVLRGNDEVAYFKMLEYDLKQQEVAEMKKVAQRTIPKINACTMILLVGILTVLTGVLMIDMLDGAGAIFG